MPTIDFWKVHGSGNEFFLIDEDQFDSPFTTNEKEALSRTLCNRKHGIGADGILFVGLGDSVDGYMEIFNADGTKASMCGNGLRCAGRYILEKLGKEQIVVRTEKADLQVKRKFHKEEQMDFFQVEISPVSFVPHTLPMHTNLKQVIDEKLPFISEDLTFTALSVPNPHLVAYVKPEFYSRNDLIRIGELVNNKNPWFPDGVNVSFFYVPQEGEMIINTFERGVGLTHACGTAMAASGIVAAKAGFHPFEKPMTVYNNGGYCQIIPHRKNQQYWADLIGNGTFSFLGKCEVNKDFKVLEKWSVVKEYKEEDRAYERIRRRAKEKIFQIFGKDEL